MTASKKKTPQKGYYQVIDGEWVSIPWRGFKEQCCGCGLIHKTDYRVIENNTLQFKATVDNRATAAARRPFKFTKET